MDWDKLWFANGPEFFGAANLKWQIKYQSVRFERGAFE